MNRDSDVKHLQEAYETFQKGFGREKTPKSDTPKKEYPSTRKEYPLDFEWEPYVPEPRRIWIVFHFLKMYQPPRVDSVFSNEKAAFKYANKMRAMSGSDRTAWMVNDFEVKS